MQSLENVLENLIVEIRGLLNVMGSTVPLPTAVRFTQARERDLNVAISVIGGLDRFQLNTEDITVAEVVEQLQTRLVEAEGLFLAYTGKRVV